MGVASTGSHTPSLEELQRVISAMRSVVEKLQRENERLRREGKAGKERERERVRQLQGENRSMKVCVCARYVHFHNYSSL